MTVQTRHFCGMRRKQLSRYSSQLTVYGQFTSSYFTAVPRSDAKPKEAQPMPAVIETINVVKTIDD